MTIEELKLKIRAIEEQSIEELKLKIRAIEEQSEVDKNKIRREYALKHNIVQVGDVIKDHSTIIKVESIGVYLSLIPCCIYRGYKLNKDGVTPSKKKGQDKIKDLVYQTNLIEVNGINIKN